MVHVYGWGCGNEEAWGGADTSYGLFCRPARLYMQQNIANNNRYFF